MGTYNAVLKRPKGGEGDRCLYPTRLDTYGCGAYDRYRKYVRAVVTNKWHTTKPSFKITLRGGTELICSGDHRWLTERGWKYTTNDRKQGPHLTINNTLRGLSFEGVVTPEQTEQYRRGYLSGVIRGDGNLGIYDYSGERRERDVQYHFRLAVNGEGIVARTKEYLESFGVMPHDFLFPMKQRDSGETINVPAIRTSSTSTTPIGASTSTPILMTAATYRFPAGRRVRSSRLCDIISGTSRGRRRPRKPLGSGVCASSLGSTMDIASEASSTGQRRRLMSPREVGRPCTS